MPMLSTHCFRAIFFFSLANKSVCTKAEHDYIARKPVQYLFIHIELASTSFLHIES